MPTTFDELIAAAEKITKDGAKDGDLRLGHARHPVRHDHGHALRRRL